MRRQRTGQAGSSLLDALIALLVLCLGMLALGQMLARNLAETRTTNARGIALQHIDALRESMSINAAAARSGSYALDWDDPPSAAADCGASACDAAQLAAYDLATWRESLRAALPSAKARVFGPASAHEQIGVAVAWLSNERSMTAQEAAGQGEILDTFNGGIDCPPRFICHLSYVQP